jgi:hypothetical protein
MYKEMTLEADALKSKLPLHFILVLGRPNPLYTMRLNPRGKYHFILQNSNYGLDSNQNLQKFKESPLLAKKYKKSKQRFVREILNIKCFTF